MAYLEPVFATDLATVHHGDSLTLLPHLEDGSVDAVVTDPPYGLSNLTVKKTTSVIGRWLAGYRDYSPGGRGFMSQSWDAFVPPPALWDEVFRVIRPGGFVACFAGARTQDLMSLSIRLAGFTIKDQLHWLRADSFPKSKNSLKSAYEPIILAQKPPVGSTAKNRQEFGTGQLNIEQSRIPFRNAADRAESTGKNQHGKYGTAQGGNSVYGDFSMLAGRTDYDPQGRLPTNLLLSPESGAALDAANPQTRSTRGKPRAVRPGSGWSMTNTGAEYDDCGGPSRFFPVFDGEPFVYSGRAPAKERPVGTDGTKHTTVKPLKVMRWLVRLVVPPGGTVLDPFAGSGTTLQAAAELGLASIGVESHEPYMELIAQRLAGVPHTSQA